MLRKLRIAFATLFFAGVTLLSLDFTGTLHAWLGWMAHVQLLPAILALHVGIVAALLLVTLLFGRLYCSVVCPLGVMQDLFGWLGRRAKRNRYAYSPERRALRYGLFVLFIVLLVAGLNSVAILIAPYSAYGRIAQSLFAPLYALGNNALAWIVERADSYTFYSTEVWVRSGATLAVAVVTLVAVAALAWRGGRTWCNTVCPVGTLLGFVSRFSWFRPVIDEAKCVDCKRCARNCKAACIDAGNHRIDYSRCVVCMDCLEQCHVGAISYTRHRPRSAAKSAPAKGVDKARRSFLAGVGTLAVTSAVKAQEMKVDGGLAAIVDRKIPERKTPIVPPGARSLRHLAQHCTGCQLCVAACPNGVLRPSGKLMTLMQPESSYERGYCRPECTRCADVCPTHAIEPITRADKSSIQIGHAVWVRENCVPLTDGVTCGNCARHCPTGAIRMVPIAGREESPLRIPVVDEERCIGCGACENLCPSRPFAAIYIEGHENHRII